MAGSWRSTRAPALRANRYLVVLIALLVLGIAITDLLPLVGRHCQDLEVYRLGGRAVLHGLPLYDQRTGQYGFTYPPLAALVVSPLTPLPFGTASTVLAVGSLVSLVVVMAYSAGELWDRVRMMPSVWGTVALIALVCCAPVRGTFWNGQVNLILAALVLADVRGHRLRGVGVGLAAAIKLTPLVFVVYLALVGRRREALNALGSFVAVLAATWLVLPADSSRFWLHQLVDGSASSAGIGDEARTSDQSIHGLVLRLVGTGPAAGIWIPMAAAAMVVGLGIAVRLTRLGRHTLAIGVVGVTGCVVSPVAWVHHWVWAIPWLVGMAATARGVAARMWVVAVGVVVVAWDKLPYGILPSWPPLTFIAQNDLVLCALVTGLVAGLHPLRHSAVVRKGSQEAEASGFVSLRIGGHHGQVLRSWMRRRPSRVRSGS